MTENKRFCVEFDDADIWEGNHFLAVAYNHHNAKKITERLNKLVEENEQLKQRLQKIQNGFEVNWTQNNVEFDKDKLYIKDNNTEIRLEDANLFIEVYIPQINGYYRFKYRVTGRSLMMELIENYNSNGDTK